MKQLLFLPTLMWVYRVAPFLYLKALFIMPLNTKTRLQSIKVMIGSYCSANGILIQVNELQ